MKKVLFLIFASLLVLGACGNNVSEKKEDNKTSEHKKSNDLKKDKKSDDKKDNSKYNKKPESKNNDTTSNESQSTSKNDNGKSQDNNGNNERTQGNQATQQNNNEQQSSNQQSQNNNGYMTQEQINEWNKNKSTTHDESQMGYGRGDYEQARKDSEKVWNDPNAHVGGPRWVGKNEGYESWAKRQQEVQNSIAE
ncbi:hypothetical protein [Staphylococcus epidermidis]|uniref:hypothetical protein n=1 Tax=Staphylococcus epidermidis TaxID=1282 RepID=UPI001D0D1F1D|nr:hypothetical protein [Staphylococcus epidermidis]MCC2070797.1 hypothetical protein [Staphylococcus epidermidis]